MDDLRAKVRAAFDDGRWMHPSSNADVIVDYLTDLVMEVIEALSNTKEAAVARVLSKYFQQGKTGSDQHIRESAMAAVKKLAKTENCGEAVVPHLLPGVRNGFTRFYTTQVLQEITGQKFDVKHWAQWSSWYRSRHPEWKESE